MSTVRSSSSCQREVPLGNNTPTNTTAQMGQPSLPPTVPVPVPVPVQKQHHQLPSSPSIPSPLTSMTIIARPKATSGFRRLLEQAIVVVPPTPQPSPVRYNNNSSINSNDIDDDRVTVTTGSRQSTTGGGDTLLVQPPSHAPSSPSPSSQVVPMIDYWRFKKRLKFFARRRCRILQHILQQQRQQRLRNQYYNSNININTNTNTTTDSTDYLEMTSEYDNRHQEFLHPSLQRQHPSLGVGIIGGEGYENPATSLPLPTANTSTIMDDIYTHAPLSYNLSMDPHAHIGMGRQQDGSGIDIGGGEDDDYVEMNDLHRTNVAAAATTCAATATQPVVVVSHHHNASMSSHVKLDVQDDDSQTTTGSMTAAGGTKETTAMDSNVPTTSTDVPSSGNNNNNQYHNLFCFDPFHTTTASTSSSSTPTVVPSPHQQQFGHEQRRRHHQQQPRRTTLMRQLSISERNEIITFLEWEMDQCYMYYLSQYSLLLQRYNDLLVTVAVVDTVGVGQTSPAPPPVGYSNTRFTATTNNSGHSELTVSQMIELGDDIMELMVYCTINIIITQQILIRYDAMALSLEGTPMLNYYIKKVLQPPSSSSSLSSSYYKVRYHDVLYHLANQFITTIVITSSSSSSSTSSLSDTTTDDVTGVNYHDDASCYTTRAYVTHFQEQMDMFRTMLDSLPQQQQLQPSPAHTTLPSPTTILNMGSQQNSTSSSALNTMVVTDAPISINTTTEQQQQQRHANNETSPYWYNTIRYKLSSYSEIVMRYSIKAYIQMGLFEDRLGLEPGFLSNRGQSLSKEMESIVQWRQTKQNWYTTYYSMTDSSKKHIDQHLFHSQQQQLYYYNYYNPLYHRCSGKESTTSSPPRSTSSSAPTPPATTTVEKKLSALQVFHLTLNMLAAFLYCMNYYIVEPSSTMYVNRLGAHDAMSGTLIGMMPLAAFLSSIPYSMWTNRSFRHPFIMSSIMLIAGNLLYSFADQFGVVWIALMGRFMAGLGAPKCIIRRYMADTTPVSLRTSVNAGFGMVVAAGSAMGPAMAIVLNRFEYTCYVKHLGLVTLNGLTLPGYFMACLWLTFFVIIVLTFEEPDREGLKEQKELEARGVVPSSPSNMVSFGIHDESDDMNNVNHNANIDSEANQDIHTRNDDELYSVFSGESNGDTQSPSSIVGHNHNIDSYRILPNLPRWMIRVMHYSDLITLPVRICLGLLFCKVFTIEALVSSTSALTKNRYQWQVTQVGKLGFANGVMVIPFSILVGRLSMTYQDHVLMKWLVSLGCCGMFLLIDLTDLVGTPRYRYNAGHVLAVAPRRYILGYFLSYLSIQAFEGVIGSTLSKVIPTALASGTFNSGLLATLVDTFGRTCGDLFISAAGFLSLRQLMNLLFIPGFVIMLSCLIVIERCRDLLSV